MKWIIVNTQMLNRKKLLNTYLRYINLIITYNLLLTFVFTDRKKKVKTVKY